MEPVEIKLSKRARMAKKKKKLVRKTKKKMETATWRRCPRRLRMAMRMPR